MARAAEVPTNDHQNIGILGRVEGIDVHILEKTHDPGYERFPS